MSSKKEQNTNKGLESIGTTLSKSEQFIEKNQKILMYFIVAIIAIVGIYWAYQRLYKMPREKDALSQMFVAQRNFEKDSFNLALNGTLDYPGFIAITEDYSGTKSANLANYYIGVCYLNIGEFDSAIEYLQDFNTKDLLLGSQKYGIIGDCYVEKDDYENAIKFYKKAISKDFSNDFTSPIYLKKLGLVYEQQGNNTDAADVYSKIYNDYPKSNEARTIEKYIERAKLNIQ